MTLPQMIKDVRQELFMSQEAFADSLGVTIVTINRWERGKTIPNLRAMKNIKAFCENHGISFDSIETEWRKARMVKEND